MTTLVQMATNQYQPAVLANELFTSVSPAGIFGRKHTTTTGLTWGYYGGYLFVNGVLTSIADGTVSLTASNTNYVEATAAGVVSANVSGFTAGRIPLYEVSAGSSTISSYVDQRVMLTAPHVGSALAKTWPSDAALTLSAAEARAKFIVLSGATLTTTRDLLVPTVGDWFIQNNTGGSQSIRVVEVGSPQGSGVTIGNGSGAFVYVDASGVVQRASADV